MITSSTTLYMQLHGRYVALPPLYSRNNVITDMCVADLWRNLSFNGWRLMLLY